MVIVRIMDGLGNQLFQYAMARRIAYENGSVLKLDVSGYKNEKNRAYSLGHFRIAQDFAAPADIRRTVLRSLLEIPLHLADVFTGWRFSYKRAFFHEDEIFLRYDPRVMKLKDNVYLWGHWQCERYFAGIEDVIRKDLVFNEEPSGRNLELAGRIRSVEAVSVHVRRGDYVHSPQNRKDLGACGMDYYERAAKKILESVAGPHFFVFSDDPQWCRENLKWGGGASITVVDHNGPGRDYEDLRLMSLCKHHVIANSSFSWWGAWLSPGGGPGSPVPGKVVIAPARWFHARSRAPKDIIPDRWIKL